MTLKFYTSVAIELKLKVRKVWGLIPMFGEVTREKAVWGHFCCTHPSPPLPPLALILNRVKGFLGLGEEKVLTNDFILSNFDLFPLVWFISSAMSLNTAGNLQKRTLPFLFSD